MEQDYTVVFIINGARASGDSGRCGECSVSGSPQPTMIANYIRGMGSMHAGITIWRLDNAKQGQTIQSHPTANEGITFILGIT